MTVLLILDKLDTQSQELYSDFTLNDCLFWST